MTSQQWMPRLSNGSDLTLGRYEAKCLDCLYVLLFLASALMHAVA